MGGEVLTIQNLTTSVQSSAGWTPIVRGISYSLQKGKTLSIVGESGCGKSLTSLSLLRLLPPKLQTQAGSIHYHQQDLLTLPEHQMRTVRGRSIAMVFQEPMAAFNPVLRIGAQIGEQIRCHFPKISKTEIQDRVVALLQDVGIPSPGERSRNYPHQLSGGMRQRAMIAMALSCNPEVLIADEPTTALDVTIQAQILELMQQLQAKSQMAVQWITHDLGVVSELADEVVVMYAGAIVEKAPAQVLFSNPRHPYTVALLESLPYRNRAVAQTSGHRQRLRTIPGSVPPIQEWQVGCPFRNRCSHAKEICAQEAPVLTNVGSMKANGSADKPRSNGSAGLSSPHAPTGVPTKHASPGMPATEVHAVACWNPHTGGSQ